MIGKLNTKHILVILNITLISIFFSCRETVQFANNPSITLNFTTDTVHFDTIFTSIGSTTKQFKFFNRNDKPIKTTISLGGGSNSYYRLNIDGQSTNQIIDYEIMANDSAYIFVEVNINPQNSNSPMVITDSITFYTNGNQQNVKLIAYGQDVHLYNSNTINTDTTWTNDKPYLIYNSILINKDITLSINEGVQIHFHNESAMWVLGTLDVQGSNNNPVVFQGDRLDSWYEYSPGQWYGKIRNTNGDFLIGGLFFYAGSFNNTINHAIIRNGVFGIQLYDTIPNNELKLTLSNSIIKDMSSIGLLTQTSNIIVYNTVIANCGYYAAVLNYGGNYEFYHSTIGNYYEHDSRKTPSLIFNNYYTIDGVTSTFDFNANFGNCIVYGSVENEFMFDLSESDNLGFLFDHCMMKLDDEFDTSSEDFYKNIIRHKDSLPRFTNTYEGNFRLDTLSAAKDKGSTIYSLQYPIDQDGESRTTDGKPDLGAYERIK